MAWFNEVEIESTEIIALKRNVKGTGWILEGIDCDCFAWNSNEELIHLLVAIASWVDAGQGKAIQVVKNSKIKCGFNIKPLLVKGKPVATTWKISGNGYAVAIDGEDIAINPFL